MRVSNIRMKIFSRPKRKQPIFSRVLKELWAGVWCYETKSTTSKLLPLSRNCFRSHCARRSLSGLASELSRFALDVVTQNFQKGKIGSQLTKPVFPLEFPLSRPFDTAFFLLLPQANASYLYTSATENVWKSNIHDKAWKLCQVVEIQCCPVPHKGS